MALFLSIFPIVLLIWLMVKKNSMPSYVALPITAVLIYAIKLFYFGDAGMLLNATAASGLVKTLTPITVIFGAIMFNRMMETTGCIDVIRKWLATISPNPVAQLMIIGWAFAFMIEGASGFGTPAAIAAPILMSLGFNPLKVAIFTLVMNSVPVSFGAVGTPTWFGFAPLNLSAEDILAIGRQTYVMHFFAGFVIPVIGLGFIVPWSEIRKNLGFVAIAVFSCTIPYVALAMVNEEFPSLVSRRNRPDGVRIRRQPRLGLEQRPRQRPECRKSAVRPSRQSTRPFGYADRHAGGYAHQTARHQRHFDQQRRMVQLPTAV